jgi:hypothetical protein
MQIRSFALCAGLGALTLDAAHVLAQSSPSARGRGDCPQILRPLSCGGRNGRKPDGACASISRAVQAVFDRKPRRRLAEGIVVGHPAVPRFTFDPREINALISYISSLKNRGPSDQPKTK